jgi:FKBP-type peptidyl-prolyl cis-trans isomerase SlyD
MTRALTLLIALAVPVTVLAQTPTAPAPAPTAPAPSPGSPGPTVAPAIENGSSVQLEYTLSDDAGKLLDSNKGQQPLTYTQGGHQLIAALEKQLVGMQTGQQKKVVLKPEDAFGTVDPAAQTEVPKDALPPDALVVGAQLMARNAAGEGRPVVVKEIKDKTVVVDLNHPLAGKTLVFDVKVLGIEPPSKAEEPKPAAPRPGEATPTK